MKKTLGLAILALGLSAAAPAWAAPSCEDTTTGFHGSFSIQFGRNIDTERQGQIDQMRLRQVGVDASRVERWNGCLRAFVRSPGGGESMQFFDPRTLQQVF